MKSHATRWAGCGLAVLTLSTQALGPESLPPLAVPARTVPVPTTVSPDLQEAIATPPPPFAPGPTTPDGWKKLQREHDSAQEKVAQAMAKQRDVKVKAVKVAGVKCYRVTPKGVAASKEKYLIVHLHGGGFVFNAGLAGTTEALLLADASKMPVLSVDYRMPPDHPFPAAPDDVLAVWKAVLQDYDPKDVVMGGTSAGGALVMTTMLRLKADNLPMPAAIFIGTPGADLSKIGDSFFLNAEVDHVLGRYEGWVEGALELYAGGEDLKDPLVSPLYGDLSGFPPAILVSGTRDLLLSPTIRTHRKLRTAGVPAELHVYEGQSHADYLLAFDTPEAQDVWEEITWFFDRHLRW